MSVYGTAFSRQNEKRPAVGAAGRLIFGNPRHRGGARENTRGIDTPVFSQTAPIRQWRSYVQMTPSEYGEGSSLAHDRMQADVLDWIRAYGEVSATRDFYGEEIELRRAWIGPEVGLKIKGVLRGFVDILERWEPVKTSDNLGRTIGLSIYCAYELKPKLTTIGGLIRQMRAQALLIEQWTPSASSTEVRSIPVVMHDDPEVPLLRRLWHGPVAVWNAEEKAMS